MNMNILTDQRRLRTEPSVVGTEQGERMFHCWAAFLATLGIGSGEGGGSPKSKVQGPRSKVQGPRSKVQGPRSKVQGPRSKVQGPRSKVQGPRSKVQSPRSKVQGPRSKRRRTGSNHCASRFNLQAAKSKPR